MIEMPTGSHVREKHAVYRQIKDTRVQCIQLQKELSAKIHYSLTQIYVFLQITSNTSYINIAFGTNRFRSRAPFVIKLPLITVLNEMVINVSIYSSLTIYNKKDLKQSAWSNIGWSQKNPSLQ